MKTKHLVSVLASACALLSPLPVSAQAVRSGATFSLGGTTAPVILPDVAHDPLNNRWLQVAGNGFIEGHLLDASGGILAAMRINVSTGYAQNPRVEFGADSYLVTWHETIGNFAYVRGRRVGTDGTPLGGDIAIGPGGSSWLAGAAIAYSTASREFLVAWVGNFGPSDDILAQRVSADGNLLGRVFPGETTPRPTLVSVPVPGLPDGGYTGTRDWDREPSIAYNPDTDQFYVAYASYSTGNYGYVSGRRMQAGTGALVGDIQQLATNVASRIPSVIYNPATAQYLIVWHHSHSRGAAFYGQVLNGGDASLVGGLRVISSYYVAYDALDIDYNRPSGEFLLVTHGRNWEDAAVSIRGTGDPVDNGFVLTNTPDVRALKPVPEKNDGNYNPRIAASRSEKKWLVVTSSVFAAVSAQFASSGGTGAAGPPTPPPAPPAAPPVSAPRMNIDLPRTGSTVANTFSLGGWAIDFGSPSGTGIDSVQVWAYPTTGAPPIFAGVADLGVSRPDVGAAFGSSRFGVSGYSLAGTLPAGSYDLIVYAHSTVTSTFNNSASVRVTVLAPQSLPRMAVDLPGPGQNISQNIRVAGWALDAASVAGTGVNAVDVWAYPVAGGNPVFIGSATLGAHRPDVAAAFGEARYSGAGFDLYAVIPPGEYNLVVFARSSVIGVFNNSVLVRIRVL